MMFSFISLIGVPVAGTVPNMLGSNPFDVLPNTELTSMVALCVSCLSVIGSTRPFCLMRPLIVGSSLQTFRNLISVICPIA